MTSKKGYLRYKCVGCGAIVKVPFNDIERALKDGWASASKPMPHRCDPKHEGIANLIGGTYEEEQKLP